MQGQGSQRRRALSVRLAAIALVGVGAAILLTATRTRERNNDLVKAEAFARYDAKFDHLSLAAPSWERELLATPLPVVMEVEPGETLGELFSQLGLGAEDARELTARLAQHIEPRRVKAGTAYSAYFGRDSQLEAFELAVADRGRIHLGRAADGWQSDWRPFVRHVEIRTAEGRLEASLEAAIRGAGAPAVLAYEMADVLQWDLDFTRDLRVGDRFRVVFEEVYLDGEYASLGAIQALWYENRGSFYEAYRFGEAESYYDAEGRPLKKMFLRSPLKFSRITSRFSKRRFHPVLKRYRPHYGVDYGAPVGTPVRVTAGGTVTFAGWNRGGGKTVKVRHPGGYESNYLHLSGYAKGISSGRTVRQGEVVGYVGSTGLSTGPHLDYRVKRNGRWIDPLSIKSVPAKALSVHERAAFLRHRDQLRDLLLASGEDGWELPGTSMTAEASPGYTEESVSTEAVAAGTR